MTKTIKRKIDKILKEAHLIINESSGTDISKTQKAKAKLEARKILRQIKDLDQKVWDCIKFDIK
jgi:hypothetical protein